MQTSVVIQAGGESRRMGQDKALLPFLGRPLIERVIERVSGLGDEVLVTTNQPSAYEFLRLPLFPDIRTGVGALGGLYTALSSARYELVAVVACDMPFASARLLSVLRDRLVAQAVDVSIPRSPEGYEPLHAVYRRETCLPAVERALDAGERRMISWFSGVKVEVLEGEALEVINPGGKAFFNLNTPEDWQSAEELARGESRPDVPDVHIH